VQSKAVTAGHNLAFGEYALVAMPMMDSGTKAAIWPINSRGVRDYGGITVTVY